MRILKVVAVMKQTKKEQRKQIKNNRQKHELIGKNTQLEYENLADVRVKSFNIKKALLAYFTP